MDVLFVTVGDNTMASTRYRVLNALPLLEDAGILPDTLPITNFDSASSLASQVLREAGHYDIVYIQKSLFPPIHYLPPVYHKLLSSRSAALVYDFDDALHAARPWYGNEPRLKRIQLHSILREATTVVTGSKVLSEYARQFNSSVHSLPTALPKQKYDENRMSQGTDEGKTTIGWIGNPENLWYLGKFEQPLIEVLEENEDVELCIITDPERADVLSFEERIGDDVIYERWSLERELELLSGTDVVIRPLTDNEWTRGKGGFTSVVQAMALGIPVVVSPISLLSSIVTHGECGYHARTEADWKNHLDTLLNDPKMRERYGDNARQAIKKLGWWTSNYADALADVLHSTVEGTSVTKASEYGFE